MASRIFLAVFSPKPGEPRGRAGLAGALEFRDAGDAQFLVQRGDLFRAQPADLEQFENCRGKLGAQFLVEFKPRRSPQFMELVAQAHRRCP